MIPVAIHRTVRGRAWIDLDDDRALDPGEPALTGATAPVTACVTEALRAVRYRASGIVVRAVVPVVFRR